MHCARFRIRRHWLVLTCFSLVCLSLSAMLLPGGCPNQSANPPNSDNAADSNAPGDGNDNEQSGDPNTSGDGGDSQAPVAADQSVTVVLNTPTVITLTASSSADGAQVLTYTLVSQPSHGTLFGTPPDVVYTPDTNYFAPDSFTFQAAAGAISSNVATVSVTIMSGKPRGAIVTWGDNTYGQCMWPVPNRDFVAVAGGVGHTLGVKADGSIVAWGDNSQGQCDVPAPNVGFVAAAGGWTHSLGLKADGSIVAWGAGACGQSGWPHYGQSCVPVPNAGFVAVAAKGQSLGLKGDGTIVAWGGTDARLSNVPAPNADFIAIAAGSGFNLGLKADGGIVQWGACHFCECCVPSGAGHTAIAAVSDLGFAIGANGLIVAWGDDMGHEFCLPPAPNSDFVAVAGGWGNCGLKTDGTLVVWTWGQPSHDVTPTLSTGYIAIGQSCGFHGLGLKAGELTNEPPVAQDQSANVPLGTATVITLTATDPDSFPTPLTYTVLATPTHGTLTGSAPNLTYTPTQDFTGADSLTFQAFDGAATTNTGTVSITVQP